MKYKKIWGYIVYDNGLVIGKNGQKLNTNYHSFEDEDGNKLSYSRFVYYAFNRNFDYKDKNKVVIHKNNKKSDFSIKNLCVVSKKEIIQGQKNKNSKLTDEQVDKIRKIYNGEHQIKNMQSNISYRTLAKMFGVSHSTIQHIISGKMRNKKNYKLK